MKHNPDVLDMVMIQISNRTKREDLLLIVHEAIIHVRQSYAGDTYIRHDKPEVRMAHTLWMQQKATDKTMKEIYQLIADQIGTVSPRTIEVYVSQFLKGFNPHDMNMEW